MCVRQDGRKTSAPICAKLGFERGAESISTRMPLAEVVTQTRLLLQQERCDQLVRRGRVCVVAVDRQPVIATGEFVLDQLPAVGVLHEGRRVAVCAAHGDARGIGQCASVRPAARTRARTTISTCPL